MKLQTQAARWQLRIDCLRVQGVPAHQQAAWVAGLREGLMGLQPEQLQGLHALAAAAPIAAPTQGGPRQQGQAAAQALLSGGGRP